MTTIHSRSAGPRATINAQHRSWRAPAAAALAAFLLVSCSHGKGSSSITVHTVAPTTTAAATTTTATTVAAGVTIGAPTVTAVATESSAGEEGKIDDGIRAQVLDTVTKYVQMAVAAPLTGNTTPAALDQVMTAHAAAALTPDRRSVLTDEGVTPLQTGQVTTNNMTLTGLVGTDQQMTVVSAHLDLVITGTANGAPASIKRSADFTLVPDSGGWRIDAFDMNVERDLP